MKPINSEADIAKKVCEFLADDGWDVYEEVLFSRGDSRADIMCKRGELIWAVEVKKSLTFEVIAQAKNWQFWVHGALIAVPAIQRGSNSRGRNLAKQVCENCGIGIIEVAQKDNPTNIKIGDTYHVEYNRANMILAPRLNRDSKTIKKWTLPLLSDELKKWGAKAGNNESDFWSPFKRTCRDAQRYVAEHEGVFLKELMENISHHYSNDACARSSFGNWVRAGKVPGLRIDQAADFRLRVYTTEKGEIIKTRMKQITKKEITK